MPWFSYTPITTPQNVGDPNNYTLVGTNPPSCNTPKEVLCAVQTNISSGTQPNISAALILEIANTMQTRQESNNVLLRPFV